MVELAYFCVLFVANILNCLTAVASVYLILRRACREPAARREEACTGAISVIVPCYLPNEENLIVATVMHIATCLEWPGKLTLYVVYNTPHRMPAAELALRALDGRIFPGGRTVIILEAEGSTSKAENLDYAIERVSDPHVALYDADHRPEPGSLVAMMHHMDWRKCHVVQGSTYIRNTHGSLLAKAVDAEFFVTHFVYFPAMEALAGTGNFGGSNALWQTSVLKKYGFNRSMHCEDVDVSARIILDNHRIRFCPTARSGELAPASFGALVTQRLRWFIGWEQCTAKYWFPIFFSPLTWRRKLGFLYMFHFRWALLVSAFMGACINPIIMSPFLYPLWTWSFKVRWCVYVTLLAYTFVALYSVCSCMWHERARPYSWLGVGLFFVFGWGYIAWHAVLQSIALARVARGTVGEWTVTRRTADMTDGLRKRGLGEPLLGHHNRRHSEHTAVV